MGQFVVGTITGIVMCSVVLMVRCVLWYEKKHPEDDYWHRLISEEKKTREADKDGDFDGGSPGNTDDTGRHLCLHRGRLPDG